MKTLKFSVLLSFALGIVLTLTGLLLKWWNVNDSGIVFKAGLLFDAIFVLLLVTLFLKAILSKD